MIASWEAWNSELNVFELAVLPSFSEFGTFLKYENIPELVILKVRKRLNGV